MKVIAKDYSAGELPIQYRQYLNQKFSTPGKEYNVHAVVTFNGITFVQIIDDLGDPAWTPHVVFSTSDTSIPDDWICNLPLDLRGDDVSMIIGPDFIAKDKESYIAMVELQADQVDRFWKRIDALEKASNGGDEDWGE